MGGLAVLASLNFAMSTYNSRKANNHIEKLETWRSKVVKGCVESVVENEASHFLRSKYPGYEACGKANRDYDVQTECYPSDPEMSLWGSVRNAFISGYVSVDPYPSSREYLLPILLRRLTPVVKLFLDQKFTTNLGVTLNASTNFLPKNLYTLPYK